MVSINSFVLISSEVRNYVKLELFLDRSPTLFRQIFKKRYFQFNGGQIWDDTSICGINYLNNVIIKNKKFNLTPVQKIDVSNGNSNKWDLSMVVNILIYGDRPTTLSPIEIQELDEEKKVLEQLRNIRNTMAHFASKSVNPIEFNKLKDDSIFEPLTQEINETNVKEALQLNSLGAQAHKDGQFSDAISYFTKATVLPGVADHDRAIFFSNMSSSRLKSYEQQVGHSRRYEIDNPTDERYRALQDAKQARNLWPLWWKGHFCVGNVYVTLNELEKAINSFERAWALDPTNNDVKKALDENHYELGRQQRQEHLDPETKPKSILEQLSTLGMDPEEVRNTYKSLQTNDPSLVDVEKGYKYEHGDIDIKQNYGEAAKYFAKAVRQGNAEGMFNLARFTDCGLGAKKDHDLAQNLYEQAASQPSIYPKSENLRNPGVAEAEHALGLRYAEGVMIGKRLGTAACWYKRAFDHGNIIS
ncbi:hypothetical protein I4U23_011175 [Adineta vaga]|nr:hypothetical protein I4U23_011175 [Adineta vaga]